ncbi:rhamnogalacturonan lyase [Natronoflexus pectinivorans]|uniref:Rhamnogalacturonan endolyase/rhamnogalacturonan exolyase n=1 Tax=Natronoflexus pectinivorans TaxID=682526 RepID=A0A4R2GH85_9BACT|nr:rhamnogalacturonan lyase [Natronoflexus pectinivorans]TCO07746.1 rhamnogalacturonan endolyase/rhamnogalacturonan exolyase [Natronoflexus pectinivorans]
MRLYIIFVLILGSTSTLCSQMRVENLNRGLVAVRQHDGYYLKWRLLGNEPYNTSFDIYRNNKKINDRLIVDVTSYVDSIAPLNSVYNVKAIIDDLETEMSSPAFIINNTQGENAGFFDISLRQPADGIHGGKYFANDASVGDLTGDGEYEIVVSWSPNNARDNSHRGISDNVLLDAYTLNGEFLWRIDLGPNIRAGAHYTQFLVFDLDGNGRSEIMVKTAPGSRDGKGHFLSKGTASDADHSIVYRNRSGYILEGPEYITIFDGLTGAELATADYWPLRGNVSDWGDSYGNRVDRFNATIAYLDGERPSAVFQRGYYTRMTLAAWDWRDGKLSLRWTFDSDDPGHEQYAGQGNHSIHVIDANNDGRHDIVTGSAVIGSDGTGMHTTGMGHGDATHVTYMIKDHPYPQIFMPHESGGHGVSLRHANSGEIIFNHRNPNDVGRGVGAEIDPEIPGFHFWGTHRLGLFDMNGDVVGDVPNSMNFIIWWDGDLSRELMNRNRIDKWSISNNSSTRLLTAEGARSINGTKATPVLQADLFGDWREEVVLLREDGQALRVYTTTMPTTHKLYTFMHDPVYRVAISWQNSSYNQPPHPGFYVATDMDFPPPMPNVVIVDNK